MPQPLRMHQIKRIIELYHQGRSIWETKRLTGLSRTTIREYLQRVKKSGVPAAHLLTMDDETLIPILYTDDFDRGQSGRKTDARYEAISNSLDRYCGELKRRGVTRQLLWEEYRREHPDGYGYSQFCDHLRVHNKKEQAVMHFTHLPGEQLQVDFAGDKSGYVDISTGEWISCEVLVCIMPYSNYMYVEAVRSQKQEDFIPALTNAFTYLGGVPACIKCDNMKTAVTRANRYEPQFTEAMEHVATHYNTTILTARVRKPRDKASVEKGVDLTYKRIYAPLRDQLCYSLEQLNDAFRKQLHLFNDRSFKNKTGSRSQWFEEEKPKLKELPAERYEIKHVTYSKVQRNYHVILGEDRHQYSVPYSLIGKRLKIIYTSQSVEVYHDLKRVAAHSRNYKKHSYTTLREHMPMSHQHIHLQGAWNGDHFEQQASLIGESTLQVIKRVLSSKIFYQQSYNSCLGILRLGKQYGNGRLEAACQRIHDAPIVNYGMVANILKRNLDNGINTESVSPVPRHEQIRGADNYQ
ncbi:IS21-like element ISFK1 family transposase [soil metagenome]